MTVYQSDVNAAKKYLWEDEKVIVTATQRKNFLVGGAIVNPTTIVCTDKRLMIINREDIRIRQDVESIPYNRINSIRFENGFVSASIFLRVSGYTTPGGSERGFLKPGEQEGELPGFTKADAKAISDFINRMITGFGANAVEQQVQQYQNIEEDQQQPRAQSTQGPGAGAFMFCPNCGARNPVNAKFCENCGKELGR